jgi:hypothetical protein
VAVAVAELEVVDSVSEQQTDVELLVRLAPTLQDPVDLRLQWVVKSCDYCYDVVIAPSSQVGYPFQLGRL